MNDDTFGPIHFFIHHWEFQRVFSLRQYSIHHIWTFSSRAALLFVNQERQMCYSVCVCVHVGMCDALVMAPGRCGNARARVLHRERHRDRADEASGASGTRCCQMRINELLIL